jgi:hypothetical protein
MSLRDIVEETGLCLQTVRNIIDQKRGSDRTRLKHLERIGPDRAKMKM